MKTTRKKAAFVLHPNAAAQIYGCEEVALIGKLTDLREGVISSEEVTRDPSVLADVQIMFSGWGAPRLDAAFLASAKRLEAVFYGAGSIRSIATPEFWVRDIPITSSWQANAVPVAEFTEAVIVLSLKQFWHASRQGASAKAFERSVIRGSYGARVGLISLGMVGQMVAERLKAHDLVVMAYDPFVDQAKADALGLGVKMVSLETIFSSCDVVSLHAPNLPGTRGMITAELLASMRAHSTFINTARGAIVDEMGMIETLCCRPDLCAVLDVTHPEPPVVDSLLYTLPNVVLTPHIAGSLGDECHRMGRLAVEECRRFLNGEPLTWRVTKQMAEVMA